MGHVKRDIYRTNFSVFPAYDYDSIDKLEKALRHYLKLRCRASNGDMASTAVMIDIGTAIGLYENEEMLTVVTKKQREAIIACLVLDKSEKQVAHNLGISQEAVSARIMSGIRRVRKFLLGEELTWNQWELEEIEFICNNYYKMTPGIIARELGKTKKSVTIKACRLRKQNLIWEEEEVNKLIELHHPTRSQRNAGIKPITSTIELSTLIGKPVRSIESMIEKLILERSI